MHPRSTVDQARALTQRGLGSSEVAKITGVPVSTVRKWRSGQSRPIGENQRHEPCCPLCFGSPLDELAYAYLLGLYLGDGHLSPPPA